jgi:hypothetical protein
MYDLASLASRFTLSIVLCQIVVQIELAITRAELEHRKTAYVAASVGVRGPAILISDSQGGRHKQTLPPDLPEGIGSQSSPSTRGHDVQTIASASTSPNESTT